MFPQKVHHGAQTFLGGAGSVLGCLTGNDHFGTYLVSVDPARSGD